MKLALGSIRRRGKNGCFAYRCQVNGRRTEISLQTKDYHEALKKVADLVPIAQARTAEVVAAHVNEARGFAKQATDLALVDAWPKYERHPDRAMPHTVSEQLAYRSSFLEFVAFATRPLISIYIDEKDIIPIFQFAALDDLAQFYIWLHKNYPKNPGADVDCAGFSTLIDKIHSFANYLFNIIKNYPSSEVLNVMQQIWDSFPEDVWMKYVIQDVRKANLKRNTPTYKLDEIKRILDKDEQGIVINSPQDLLSLILDLLGKYQIHLTGKESPSVNDLWNYDSQHIPTHKEEEHFSDHVKNFLELKLVGVNIAINREVQLNRGLGSQPGSRTDIWINAFSDHSEKITLCIEVKGSWNDTTLSAINEQLTKKYMGDGGADAGILLVGWFHSQRNPVSNICKNKREDAENKLNEQTDQANHDGYLVRSVFVDCPAKY